MGESPMRGFVVVSGLNKIVLSAIFWLTALAGLPSQIVHAQEFLPPEEAFRIQTQVVDPGCELDCWVDVSIEVEPEYYLYRERFKLEMDEAVERADFVELPRGKRKFDEFLGEEIEALRGFLNFRVSYSRIAGTDQANLTLVSQGCADAGLCYPPMMTQIDLMRVGMVDNVLGSLGFGSRNSQNAPSLFSKPKPVEPVQVPAQPEALDETGGLAKKLESQPLYVVLPIFFGLGLLLAFTPCTLPMLPIVTSLVVGQRESVESGSNAGRFRAFSLAIVYVLGMSLTYALLGVVAGLSGQSLVVALQQPAVLWTFGGLLAVLGAALLAGYQIQLPASFQAWLQAKTGRLQGGQFAPVLIMGVLSALLLGPCVAPPLAGALLYIGQTGNALIGGLALFLLALGMGLPMVLIAAGAGAFLPRAGHWMKVVSGIFGFVLVAVALWVINPVTSTTVLFSFWFVWLVGAAAAIRVALDAKLIVTGIARALWTGLSMTLQLLALVYLVGLLSGAPSLLSPLQKLQGGQSAAEPAHLSMFERVPSDEFEAVLASTDGPVLLDFYADWCVSCKEFELLTLPDASIKNRLEGIRMIQVDVTENSAEDQALLSQYGLFGPPAILFFNTENQELKSHRVVGFQNVEKFGATLDAVRLKLGF